jgi:uncharacterized protein YkwD
MTDLPTAATAARRTLATCIVMAVLVGGCGGGSGRPAGGSGQSSRSKAAAATITPQVSDGQLAGAVLARPGTTRLTGRTERITGRSILPPAGRKGGVGAEASCTDADVQPTAQNISHVLDVVFCLMNAMRANAGLPALAQQALLAKASLDHSQDMVDNKYFAHNSLDGRDVVARLTDVGYIPKTGQWIIGENLAWGSGALATPKALVSAWMNSPPHRENLLASAFQDVGVGLVFGTPSKDASEGVTVTTDFGTRPAPAAAPAPGVPATTSATGGSSARRIRALRRCRTKHGTAHRRCVRAARKIR